MKNRKKTLLLAAIASLCILCGCGEKTELLEIEGEQFVKSGEDYTRIDISSKVFEPGTHRVIYSKRITSSYSSKEGWSTNKIEIPETPEGYRFVGVIKGDAGFYGMYLHIFENVERVEVTGTYNPETNEIEYLEPGVIVKDRTLEMGD